MENIIIKENAFVRLETSDDNYFGRCFKLTSLEKEGDIVTLPIRATWKQVKNTFCVMSRHSINNNF